MAGNKKIFELPLRTGVTIDDRLAIVDSGNTLTSSVKVSDLRGGTSVSSLEGLTGDVVFSAATGINITDNGTDTITIEATGAGGGGKFIGGDGTNSILPDYYSPSDITSGDNGQYGFIAGGTLNDITGTASNEGHNTIVGGKNNNINGNAQYQNIFGGTNNNIIGIGGVPKNGVILGGRENNSYGEGHLIGVVNSDNNGFSYCTMLGGNNNNITYSNRGAAGILQAINSTINGGSGGVIIGGDTNVISNGTYNAILGGLENTNSTTRGVVIGGYNNDLTGNSNSAIIGGLSNNNELSNAIVVGGQGNTITGSGDFGAIVGGRSNILQNFTNNSVIIGGQANINDEADSVVLGGSGLTTSYPSEVLVPNLTIANYASLNFSNDATAAAGGIVLGQVYHHNGDLKIRIT